MTEGVQGNLAALVEGCTVTAHPTTLPHTSSSLPTPLIVPPLPIPLIVPPLPAPPSSAAATGATAWAAAPARPTSPTSVASPACAPTSRPTRTTAASAATSARATRVSHWAQQLCCGRLRRWFCVWGTHLSAARSLTPSPPPCPPGCCRVREGRLQVSASQGDPSPGPLKQEAPHSGFRRPGGGHTAPAPSPPTQGWQPPRH